MLPELWFLFFLHITEIDLAALFHFKKSVGRSIFDLSSFNLLFAFRFYYEVCEKYRYPVRPTFDCNFLTKSPGGMGVIFLHRFRGWKDYLYVCVCLPVCAFACVCLSVCVCVRVPECNFSTTGLIFYLKVSLNRVYQDLKLCLWK